MSFRDRPAPVAAIDWWPPVDAVEQCETIAAVDPVAWDRMAGGRVLYSHGLLRAIEESTTAAPRRLYLVARGDGRLLGAIAARLHPRGEHTGPTFDAMIFGRGTGLARALGLSTLPTLACGSPLGNGSYCMLCPDLSAEAQVAVRQHLVAHVEQLCAERGWNLCLRDAPRATSPLAVGLARRCYLHTSELPVACLDIAWNSFDGYLRHLKGAHRHMAKNIRQERNRVRRDGIVIGRWRDAGIDPGRMHALLDAHNRRRNDAPFPFAAALLPKLGAYLGERALITVARCGERLVGVTVGVRDDDNAYLFFVGIDAEVEARASILGSLCYDEPIRAMTAAGIRRIHFGRLLYEYKVRRGCVLLDSDLLLRCRSPLRQQLLRPVFGLRSRVLDARTAPFPRLPVG